MTLLKRFSFGLFVAFIGVFSTIVFSCDGVLGLGTKMDLMPPVFGEITPASGSFLKDIITFSGTAQDDGVVSRVEVFVDGRWKPVTNFDSGSGKWTYEFDTTTQPEGPVNFTFRVFDDSGKITETPRLSYNIKNLPPQIELSIPLVKGDQFDDQVYLDDLVNNSPLYQGNDIMGVASDSYGMPRDYPQIKLWPSAYAGPMDQHGIPLDSNHDEWSGWHTVVDKDWNPQNRDGVMAAQFRWPLVELVQEGSTWRLPRTGEGEEAVELPVGNYRFVMRTKDMFADGDENPYPNRLDHNPAKTSPALQARYMEFNLIAAKNPIIRWVDPPKYYNGKDDFVTVVQITGPNPVRPADGGTIKVRVSENEEVIFAAGDTMGIEDIGNNQYKVSISADTIAYMLGKTPGTDISGDRVLHIEATDTAGNVTSTSRGFIIDMTPPLLSFIEPLNLGTFTNPPANTIPYQPRVTSTVIIRGVSEDNQQVKELWYALGTEDAANADMIDPGSNSGWTNSGLNTGDGPRVGHIGPGSLDVRWDGTLSSWSWRFENIADLCFFAGGSANPHTGNHYVEDRQEDGTWLSDDNLWILPIRFKLVDIAGNVSYSYAELLVDPDADLPQVSVTSHTSGQTVGGPIRVNGSAQDNEVITRVQIQVWRQKDGSCGYDFAPPSDTSPTSENIYGGDTWKDVTVTGSGSSVSWYINLNENGTDLNPPEDANIRRVLLKIRAWDASIYTPTVDKHPGRPINVILDFVGKVPSIRETRVIQSGPTGLQDAIDGNRFKEYLAGVKVSGYITLNAKVRGESSLTSIKLRGQESVTGYAEYINQTTPGQTPWVVPPPRITNRQVVAGRAYSIVGDGWGTLSFPAGMLAASVTISKENTTFIAQINGTLGGTGELIEANYPATPPAVGSSTPQYFEYELFIPLNTNSTSGNLSRYYNWADTYTMDIQVEDNAYPRPYMAQSTFMLDVDNYYPTAGYTGNNEIQGGDYEIPGTATDWRTGISVQGLDKVVVYFSRPEGPAGAPVPYSITGIAATPAGAGWAGWDTLLVKDGPQLEEARTGIGTESVETLPFFPNVRKPDGTYGSTNLGIVINDNDDLYYTKDRYWSSSPTVKQWSVRYDTNNFTDGKLTVHYVVFDTAGNATHYTKDLIVRNHAPKIADITLRTDLFGNQADPNDWQGKTFDDGTGFAATNFTARNKSLALTVRSTEGNNGINYRVSYITGYGTEISVQNTVRGNLYEVTDTGGGTTNWANMGCGISNPAIGYVFIASGPGNGGGMVREINYSTLSNLSITKPGAGTGIFNSGGKEYYQAVLAFGSGSFSGAPPPIADGNNLRFLVKVYDSMISGGQESEQLSDFRIVTLNINNVDSQNPTIDWAPFGQKFAPLGADDTVKSLVSVGDYTENIVTAGSGEALSKKGYVQYVTHKAATDRANGRADISGKVIFTGKAADNQRISKITAKILAAGKPGSQQYNGGDEFPIAKWDDVTHKMIPYNAVNTIENVAAGTAEWGFWAVGEELTIDHGHVLNWEFAWDSSTIPANIAVSDVSVIFTVEDATVNSVKNSAAAAPLGVDIVPYITEVVTGLSAAYGAKPSAFNRSANGWYPVREDEVIEIRGFNFNGNSTDVYVDNGATQQALAGVAGVSSSSDRTNIRVRIDNDTTNGNTNTINSGALRVRVNNIDSINNTNANSAAYNKEPNSVNNNNLTDNRNLYVWNTGYMLNTSNIQSPYMRMGNDASRYLSYGQYSSTGNLKVIKDNNGLSAAGAPPAIGNTGTGTVSYNTNRFFYTSIAITSGGEWAVASSNITSGQSDFNIIYNAFGTGSSNSNGGTTNPTVFRRRILGLGDDPFRVKFPRIAVQRTSNTSGTVTYPARVLVSYFDPRDANNPLVLHHGESNGNTTWTGNIPNAGSTSPDGNYVVANKNSTKAKSGQYSAIGFLSNGRPVIAWYDSFNQCLWFSYSSTTAMPTNASTFTACNWQNNAVKIGDWIGTHVDLAIDSGDNIHLAHVDVRNGGLWYTYIPADGGTTGSGGTVKPDSQPTPGANTSPGDGVKTVRVDTFLSVGTRLMINVRNKIPYISYIHNAFAETQNSVRVAWSKKAITGSADVLPGTDQNDFFTGDWEVMTVPAGTIPLIDEYVCNGVPGATTGWAAPTGSTLRTYYSTGTTNGLNNSILVSYMTQNWYEGAVLKDNIVTKTY